MPGNEVKVEATVNEPSHEMDLRLPAGLLASRTLLLDAMAAAGAVGLPDTLNPTTGQMGLDGLQYDPLDTSWKAPLTTRRKQEPTTTPTANTQGAETVSEPLPHTFAGRLQRTARLLDYQKRQTTAGQSEPQPPSPATRHIKPELGGIGINAL
jgi:hypothetical protein